MTMICSLLLNNAFNYCAVGFPSFFFWLRIQSWAEALADCGRAWLWGPAPGIARGPSGRWLRKTIAMFALEAHVQWKITTISPRRKIRRFEVLIKGWLGPSFSWRSEDCKYRGFNHPIFVCQFGVLCALRMKLTHYNTIGIQVKTLPFLGI